MNHPESANERGLDDFWECLKQIEPPLETRIANRDAVASELAHALEKRRGQTVPFWRKTLAVPWPVVAATIAILLGLSVSHSRLNEASKEGPHQDYANVEDSSASPLPHADAGSTTTELALKQSMTYLCGIGTLQTETTYFSEELE